MSDSTFKRFVEVGRVVLLKSGPYAGKIAVVAEIIDHNRAIIDGPTTSVPRQSFPYKHLTLTPLALTKLPRGSRSGTIKKHLEKEGTLTKWNNSEWAKKRAAVEKRRSLNDFARFSVMLEKKKRRDSVRKAVKALKA
ncbi:ribosomal protein L14-domain-containing protein [Lentinula aff. lateritia]|uniref:Ribosomal protein L14-domain-containing protein n=1 Tax=Lentinula aff. lateritia TaxID=2804960 RepID=A0ACC1TPV5_9AGAR|nr:ribosomal protein L14-domain-containing protein [Lentinula aff. lateritia]